MNEFLHSVMFYLYHLIILTVYILLSSDCFQEGPLSILRRSQAEKLKVRVWTRSVRNIRGICTGYIVAFDKHMNLVGILFAFSVCCLC